ncbi:MAG: SAM-dependent methyltransferase [Bauldia sp.]|nr:SAM-dependent methyltransferase [Bauldia sp.]
MTPLGEKIALLIAGNGPITVADYMALALGDPEHGYYMAREPFGRAGDFVTAPEISQIFGELIGLWAVAAFEAMGAPPRLALVELGPGRGTLMADLLRAARVRPAFLAAAEVHLVESSPRLRDVQMATLGAGAATWHDTVATLPTGPSIVVANEFFDALPVRQYVRTEAGWAERMVGLDETGNLAFGLRPLAGPPSSPLPAQEKGRPAGSGAGQDTVLEVSPASTAVMATLAERLAAAGGALLAIDYGYEGPAFGDTLQAVAGHRYADPLAEPGAADLTAHVDFAALARAAEAAGARPRPLLGQGDFLARLGIAARAARLAAGKDAATQDAIAAAVNRLVAPAAMGRLFKVLAVSHSGLALPAFDDDA